MIIGWTSANSAYRTVVPPQMASKLTRVNSIDATVRKDTRISFDFDRLGNLATTRSDAKRLMALLDGL